MVAGEYDAQRGIYEYPSTPSELPYIEVPIEEMVQRWFSRNPAYQNDLPEQPAYDAVVGDNQLRNTLAYLFAHTGNRFVRVRPGKPWGGVEDFSDTGVTIAAGATIELGTFTGYGWLRGLTIDADYESLALNVYRDGELIVRNVTCDGLYTRGLTRGLNNNMMCTVYDSLNNQYVMTWDPPKPVYFGGRIRVTLTNPDTAGHTINWYSGIAQVNRR